MRLCLLLMLSAHVALVGCTRPVEKSAASLKLNVPLDSVSASSAERAIGIGVRVTGPGMSPVDFNWESPCNSGGGSDGCAIPAPASVTFDVPQGSNRFIQVFRLMQGTSGLLFQYDDATVNMNAAEVSVTLSLTNLNQAGALQSYVGVRVLSTSTSGPSGPVRTMIYPPGGKPGFPLWPTYIFNGWITTPTFTGVDMRFVLEDGTVVLSGDPNNLTQFPDNSPALLKVSIPASLRVEGGGYSEAASAERALIGFVGPGVTGSHYACFPASTGTSVYTRRYPAAVTQPIPYPTPGWNGLVWNSTSAPSASAVTRDATTSGTLVSSQAVACSDPNLEFSTTMKFDYPRIGEDGAGAVVPFTGPFRHWPNNRPILVKFEGGKILVKWRYLPGVSVGTSGLSGVATFVTTADSSYAESYMAPGEMLKCDSLPAYGWSEISDATPNDEQTELPVSYNKFLSSQIKAVVCPFAIVNGQRKFLAAAGSDRSINRGSGELPRALDLSLFGNPAAPQPVVGLGTRDWNFPIDRFLTSAQANYVPMVDGNTVSASECASSNIRLFARKNLGAWVEVLPHTSISINGQSNQCSWASTDVNADIGSASATDVIQFKLVAEDVFRQQMGIGQGSYLTGEITASACTGSAANLTFVEASTGAVRTWSNLLEDILGPAGPPTANATDIEKFYRLRYTDAGCATADLLPRKFDQNPGETICLEDAYEIHSEDPSLVVLSPKDLTGADCTIGTAPAVDVAVVGDAGSLSTSSPGIGSGVVTHSTVPSAIAPFLSQESSAAAATNISKSRFQVMAWMAEAGQTLSRLNVVGGYLNSDGKPTDLLTASGVISTSATWTAQAASAATAAMTAVGRWIASVLSTSLPQDVFATMTVSDSAATGSLDLASLVQFKGSVKYISQLPFNGSRPAFAMVDSSTSPPTLRFVTAIESYDDDSVQLVNLAHTTNIQSSQKPFIEVIGSTNNESVAYVYAYGTDAYLCHRPSYGATATPTCLSLNKSADSALWGHGTLGANVVVKAINFVHDGTYVVIVIAAFNGTSADVIYRTNPIGTNSSGLSLNGTFALPGASTALSGTPSGTYGFSVCSFTTAPRKLLWFSSGETNATLIRDINVNSGVLGTTGVAAGGAAAPTCGGGCDASWKARCATVDNGTDAGYALIVTNSAGQTKPRVYRRGLSNNCGTLALSQLDLEDYQTGVNYNSAGAGQMSLIDSAGSNDPEQPAIYTAGKLTGTSPNQTMIYRHALGCSASTITVGVNATGGQEVTGFPGDFVLNVLQPFYMDSWHSQGAGIPLHMMGGDKGLLTWGLFR